MNAIVKHQRHDAMSAFYEAGSRLRGTSLPIVKLSKGGEWTVGADNTPLTERRFAADVAGAQLGFVLFQGGEVVDARMAPVASGKRITRDDLPEVASADGNDDWTEAAFLQLRSLASGEEYKYSPTSKGGLEAVGRLLNQFAIHGGGMPIIDLGVSYYQHKSYGKVFKPVLAVVEWRDDEPAIEWEEGPTPENTVGDGPELADEIPF